MSDFQVKRRGFLKGILAAPVFITSKAAIGMANLEGQQSYERYILIVDYKASSKKQLENYIELAANSSLFSLKEEWKQKHGLKTESSRSADGTSLKSIFFFQKESDAYKFIAASILPGIPGAVARESLGIKRDHQILPESEYRVLFGKSKSLICKDLIL